MRAKLSVLGLYTWDTGLFDQLELPVGVDADNVRDNILLECAELEVLYPRPDVMADAIGIWSRSRLPGWVRQFRALTEEYNPLHNYDRTEEWDESGSADSDGSSRNRVAGFDSPNMAPQSEGDSDSRTTTQSTRTGRAYGNIGVTTSAQMIEGEMELRAKHNIVQTIVNEFKQRFCLLVY